jgi:RND superfamily putative drug exporter
MLIKVTIRGEPSSKEAMGWVENWGEQGQSSKMFYLVGGEAKIQQEVFDAVFDNLGYVFLFIFVSNFIMLFAAFRSVLIAFKTILMNLLSLGASFGILAWVFEGGRLGMEPGSIAIMIPVFIFGLVFGISMDYGVFLVSRMYELYRQTQNNELAVLTGLASGSKTITAAAAIMIAVTAPFAFGEVVGVKQLGVGIVAAIFIDATVVRMILVPALMSMLGNWNWWAPRWLK